MQVSNAALNVCNCVQDLMGCANTLVGDETIGLKGISGGQKRRVSVSLTGLLASALLVF